MLRIPASLRSLGMRSIPFANVHRRPSVVTYAMCCKKVMKCIKGRERQSTVQHSKMTEAETVTAPATTTTDVAAAEAVPDQEQPAKKKAVRRSRSGKRAARSKYALRSKDVPQKKKRGGCVVRIVNKAGLRMQECIKGKRFSKAAMAGVISSVEAYSLRLLYGCGVIADNGGRVTLMARDVVTAQKMAS